MSAKLRDVMTRNPACLSRDASIVDAAQAMERADIGCILVMDGERVAGILTDRDIVVRAIATGRHPGQIKLAEICTDQVFVLTPTDTVADAVSLMADNAIRRIPVVENGRPVGIVSLGDLAQRRDPSSVLGQVSAAPPNH